MDQIPFASCVRNGMGYFLCEVQKLFEFILASVVMILSIINAGIKILCRCLSLVRFYHNRIKLYILHDTVQPNKFMGAKCYQTQLPFIVEILQSCVFFHCIH